MTRSKHQHGAEELPRVEDVDDAETGRFARMELDESLYELTVMPVVRANARRPSPPALPGATEGRRPRPPLLPSVTKRPSMPPLAVIGDEEEGEDTDLVAPDMLRRLRTEARAAEAGDDLHRAWEEAVGDGAA